MAQDNHYVDNKKFFQAIVDYKHAVEEARKGHRAKPPIPNYIGECFLLIATHLSYKPNFAQYSYREDMIGDGIENCICYFDNFDPAKSDKPFAYFTQIIYYAFLRRLQKERKQSYIKHKTAIKMMVDEELFSTDDEGEFTEKITLDTPDNVNEFIEKFEQNLKEKREKTKKKKEEKNKV
jgi:hypothetical protein